MTNKFTRNLGWKIASLFFAILLWLYVIGEINPSDKKTFRDIPITMVNTEVIKNKYPTYPQGKTVDVKVQARRSVIDSLNKEDIKVTADMLTLSITNAITLKVEVNKDVIDAIALNPVWRVNLEDYGQKTINVETKPIGKPAPGFVEGIATLEPNTVKIRGPKSSIAQVDRVVVQNMNIEGRKVETTLEGRPIALNENGEPVDAIDFEVNTVKVKVPIYKVKTVPVVVELIGKVPSNFRMTSSIQNPETVIVKGPEAEIDLLKEINLGEVSLDNLTVDTLIQLSIAKELPVKISLLDRSQPTEASLKIEIQPYNQKEFTYEVSDVAIYNVPQKLRLKMLTEDALKVSVAGLKTDIDGLQPSQISLRANLRDLAAGVHEVTVNVYKPASIQLLSDKPKIKVELIEDENADTQQTSIIGDASEENPSVDTSVDGASTDNETVVTPKDKKPIEGPKDYGDIIKKIEGQDGN